MSRQKGKRGEREFAALLRSCGIEARRGVQYQGGPESPDVVSSLPVHWEVKRVESLRIYDAIKQATEEAARGMMPVVAHKRNNGDWLAIMRMQDLLSILTSKTETTSNEQDKAGNT